MPELPDVEVQRRYVNATSLHKKITDLHLAGDAPLQGISAAAFRRNIKGTTLEKSIRRGKYLFLETDEDRWILLHFGMTGELINQKSNKEQPDFWKLGMEFDNGSTLYYLNPRKLGKLSIADSPDEYCKAHNIGPDLLDLKDSELHDIIAGGRGSVKSTLINQHILSGIGNIYADEILYQSGIDPSRNCSALDEVEITKIISHIHSIIDTAIDAKADPENMPEDFLIRRRGEGESCPHCSGEIEKKTVSGRSTYYCPECQT